MYGIEHVLYYILITAWKVGSCVVWNRACVVLHIDHSMVSGELCCMVSGELCGERGVVLCGKWGVRLCGKWEVVLYGKW